MKCRTKQLSVKFRETFLLTEKLVFRMCKF